ncbi:MAG: hypothetical protein ABIH83_05710 [Candidatus Micrarchaeota archaeon]
MDQKIISIIKARLRRWEGKPIDKEKLESLRTEIYKKTRKNKSAPFANIKKWIKEARKQMASAKKKKLKKSGKKTKKPSKKAKPVKKAKISKKSKSAPSLRDIPPTPRVSQSVRASLDEIKSEMNIPVAAQREEVVLKKPPMVLDKVYLQSMSFEMASMRQALEKIGRQIDKLEKELSAHRTGGED